MQRWGVGRRVGQLDLAGERSRPLSKGTIGAYSDAMVLGVRRQDFHLFKQPWTSKLARGEIVRLELADGTKAICGSERPPSILSCLCHDAQVVPLSGTKIKLQN